LSAEKPGSRAGGLSCGSARAFPGSSPGGGGSARRLVRLASARESPAGGGSGSSATWIAPCSGALTAAPWRSSTSPTTRVSASRSLEAQACGAPVIAAAPRRDPEAGGEAAILVDPDRPEEIDPSLARILLDAPFREDLREKGGSGRPASPGRPQPAPSMQHTPLRKRFTFQGRGTEMQTNRTGNGYS